MVIRFAMSVIALAFLLLIAYTGTHYCTLQQPGNIYRCD